MIVTLDNYEEILSELKTEIVASLDTETTGLNPFKGDRLFSIIVSTESEDYYFNFNDKKDHLGNFCPPRTILPRKYIGEIVSALDSKLNTVFMHDAKFDMKMIYMEKVEFKKATIFCTLSLARLVNNTLFSYSLSNLGKLIGHEKLDTVEKYITKHKLYTLKDVGKATPQKDKHFNLVPFDTISNYGMVDGRVTFELGNYILTRIKTISEEQAILGVPSILNILKNEIALTKVLFKMEVKGVKIDKDYCQRGHSFEVGTYCDAISKFEALTDIDFKDSRTVLKAAFDKKGYSYGTTEKGNASFKDENLPDNVLGNIIKDYRKAYKRAGTYFANFLELADSNNIIHCNFKQGGTSTGRMSCVSPNLQNCPKRGEEDSDFKVRACFVPRKGYNFFMIDYDQMEYRLLMDLAGEDGLIKRIVKEGLDVHTATAEDLGIDRFYAKTLNFAIIYGSGVEKLALMLNVTVAKAREFKTGYFRNLKKVEALVTALKRTAKNRGNVTNYFGRLLLAPKGTDYKIPNHYIQGSCGDIVKMAMVTIDKFLDDYDSNMLLQVHDELLFEIKEGEEFLIPKLEKIMKEAYDFKSLPLTAGVEYSKHNWHSKKEYKK